MSAPPLALGRPGMCWYDGTTGHGLVKCPDCGQNADAQFGDHGGDCLTSVHTAPARSALGIVRAYALKHRRLSMNNLRAAFDQAGIAKTSRGPAFVTAQKRGWIRGDGTVPSNDTKTKRHRIQVYESLIFDPRPPKKDPR